MTQPVASFSGIASGIQWRDMVDQIMEIEAARRFTPLATQQGNLRAQGDAWRSFQQLTASFRDAARNVQQPTAFDRYTTALTRPASGRDLISVSASSGAEPGRYEVEVLGTARAERLSGSVVASTSAALGVSGSFAVNGRTITLTADDNLGSLRDKINAANSGAGSDGVSASILATTQGARLVLSANATGASGISLTDDGAGTLAALGLSDGSTVANIGPNGATRTQAFSSVTAGIATILGIPLPTPSTIRVGGQSISVDLSVDSLTTIAAKIADATGSDSARVASEKVGSTTRYWLEVDLPVEVDGTDPLNSARTLAVLGFTTEGRADITQVVASAGTYGDQGTGLSATGATLLSALTLNGQALGIADGDTIAIGGTRGDGTSVQHSFAITSTSTLQDLLTAIGDDAVGFGAGARSAGAGIGDGRITLTDSQSGDSALGLSLALTRSGGGTVSLGTLDTTNGTVGRNRVITAGSDAVVRVNGQLIRQSTNSISNAVAGLTINALAAETGAITAVDVARDTDAATKLLSDFAAAYNALQNWARTNSAAGGALANDSTLRGMAQSLKSALLQPVAGLTGGLSSASLAGLQHDKNGVLSLDIAAFTAQFNGNLAAVRTLFSDSGSTTGSALRFLAASSATVPSGSGYSVEITQPATLASVEGAAFTTYATTGAPDTMELTDAATGRSVSVLLADGDDVTTIVQRLNSAFAADGLRLTAERTVDDRIRLSSADYGTTGGFTIAYTPGVGGDGTALLGLAAGEYLGLDVAGTINGVAASGKGQVLTGALGNAAEGITVRYTGSDIGVAGSVSYTPGVGGTLARLAEVLAAEGTGAAARAASSTARADALDLRLDDVQARLDARREALIRQFVAMEGAMAKAQALSGALVAQINSLSQQSAR